MTGPLKRWTREECRAAALVVDLKRCELIGGEVIRKEPNGKLHGRLSMGLCRWASHTFGDDRIQLRSPIDVLSEDNSLNEPEPDLAVLRRSIFTFQIDNPGPQDVAHVMEVSDTTLAFDLETKGRLYARAAIAEYWVLDVRGRRLIVHREPHSEGLYHSVTTYLEGEPVRPLAAPETEFRLENLFGLAGRAANAD